MGYSSITRSERDIEPACQKVENIIGSVDSTRGVLTRQVSPAGELAESAAKKRQCDRSHRSKERDESAIRTSITEGWPGRDHDPSLKNSWGIHQ